MGIDTGTTVCSDITYYSRGPASTEAAFKLLERKIDATGKDFYTTEDGIKVEKESSWFGFGKTSIAISVPIKDGSEARNFTLFRLTEDYQFFDYNRYSVMGFRESCLQNPDNCLLSIFSIGPKMTHSHWLDNNLDILLMLLDYRKGETEVQCCAGNGRCTSSPKTE